MTYSTHEVIGMILALYYMKYSGDTVYYPLVFSLFSSWLPDIDEPGSKVGRKMKNISFMVKGIFGHRGVTHSILGFVISVGLFYGLLRYFSLPLFLIVYFVIGYISHLLADLFTKTGIPLFYPWTKRIAVPLFRTGGMGEKVLRMILALILVYQVWLIVKVDLKSIF